MAVIHQGEVSAARLTREVSREDIGLLMAGETPRGEAFSHAH